MDSLKSYKFEVVPFESINHLVNNFDRMAKVYEWVWNDLLELCIQSIVNGEFQKLQIFRDMVDSNTMSRRFTLWKHETPDPPYHCLDTLQRNQVRDTHREFEKNFRHMQDAVRESGKKKLTEAEAFAIISGYLPVEPSNYKPGTLRSSSKNPARIYTRRGSKYKWISIGKDLNFQVLQAGKFPIKEKDHLTSAVVTLTDDDHWFMEIYLSENGLPIREKKKKSVSKKTIRKPIQTKISDMLKLSKKKRKFQEVIDFIKSLNDKDKIEFVEMMTEAGL